ncbi:uncharacterized protein METZ01_LOCUS396302 [marine metagenome]|uniref:Uncharacterized protein n=1 Tax=marine metagenome TaxID=408172 RepID=A0A382VBZ7_9ZZZZ
MFNVIYRCKQAGILVKARVSHN